MFSYLIFWGRHQKKSLKGVNRLITDNCLHNKEHCQKKLNWNAEFHIPQVHIFNTHTERMFVKGPKISFLKKHVTCYPWGPDLLTGGKPWPRRPPREFTSKSVSFLKTQVSPTPIQHTVSPKRTPSLTNLWHNNGTKI